MTFSHKKFETTSQPTFQFVSPRPSVEGHLPDGQVIEGLRCAPVGDFLKLVENQTALDEDEPRSVQKLHPSPPESQMVQNQANILRC
jgi:hypothetical protein